MKVLSLATLVTAASAFVPQKQASFGTALGVKKFAPKVQYVPCISAEELPDPGFATSGVAGGLAICIAVTPTGKIFALGDKCPPVNQPLSFGRVTEDTIEDPVLGTKFSLKTGDVVGKFCPSGIGLLLGGLFEPSGVPTYAVKKNKNSIDVQVDVNYKANFEANYWSGVLDAQGKADGKYY